MKDEQKLFTNLNPFLTCCDYTVSKESFDLLKNKEYDLLITQPIPKNLADYYKSENYISHTNSNKTVFEKVYQQVRKYTIRQKIQLINSFQTQEKFLLDIGAGTGDFLAQSKKNGWKVLGTEPNITAQKSGLKKGVELIEDIFLLKENQFDVITMWHVLEHVQELEETILQVKKLLKPNGVLIVAVPNFNSYDAGYYQKFWAAYDVPRHLWHFSQTAIQKLFAKVAMEVVKTKPMKFDAYYVSLLSEKNKTNSFNPFKAFSIGFQSNFSARRSTEYSSLIYIIKIKK